MFCNINMLHGTVDGHCRGHGSTELVMMVLCTTCVRLLTVQHCGDSFAALATDTVRTDPEHGEADLPLLLEARQEALVRRAPLRLRQAVPHAPADLQTPPAHASASGQSSGGHLLLYALWTTLPPLADLGS